MSSCESIFSNSSDDNAPLAIKVAKRKCSNRGNQRNRPILINTSSTSRTIHPTDTQVNF